MIADSLDLASSVIRSRLVIIARSRADGQLHPLESELREERSGRRVWVVATFFMRFATTKSTETSASD